MYSRYAGRVIYAFPILLILVLPVYTWGAASRIFYECDTSKTSEHLFHVTLRASTEGAPSLDFQMPAWNALYQIRDFAQGVRSVQAFNERNQPLLAEKVDKQTWRVSAKGVSEIRIEYDIYANERSPYGAQLNAHHAFLNNALVFMYIVGRKDWPIQVRFRVPEDWRIATELPNSTVGSTYTASSYDHFVDSPVEMGKFQWLEFEVKGATFAVVIDGESVQYDEQALLALLRRIVSSELDLMRDVPFKHYTFFYHFPAERAGGGMEHAYSTAIDLSAAEVTKDLKRIASVTAHEFFHLWNVKRIRPASLEPIDYTRENYTRALWFSEGVTSLYAAYTLVRSGIEDKQQFYRSLASTIESLESRPAHLLQGAEESSWDTWFDKYAYYRRPANSISYYEKGEILGLLLDVQIRQATNNERGLDDVMRYINTAVAKAGLFFDDRQGIPDAIVAISGRDLSGFFKQHVQAANEIDYNQFLVFAGLRLDVRSEIAGAIGFSVSPNFDRPMVVDEIVPGGAAEKAEVRAGDELLELNGDQVTRSTGWVLSGLKPGAEVKLTIRRDGRVIVKSFQVGEKSVRKYSIVEIPDSTPLQQTIRLGILQGKP